MILAIDTRPRPAPPRCSPLDGELIAARDEVIGRGHAERLMPMVAEMLDGHIPDADPGRGRPRQLHRPARRHRRRAWHGDRLGMPLCGFDSLALVAAGAPGDGPVAVAMLGGHGELFVAQYDRTPVHRDASPIASRDPDAAARAIDCAAGRRQRRRGAGRGARSWRGARHPAARRACARPCPHALRTLDRARSMPRARRAPRGRGMSDPRRARRHGPGHDPRLRQRRPRRGDGGHGRGLRADLWRGLDPLAMRRDPADGGRHAAPRRARRWQGRRLRACSAPSPTKPNCCCIAVAPAAQQARHRRCLGRRFIDARHCARRTPPPP